jgi:hypothetical protein
MNHVHFIDEPWKDAVDLGYTSPGWYFSDEVASLHGPFQTEFEAMSELQKYIEGAGR